jgi:uncharacterized protein YabN with tetrapyrrole methylase and pyrophosphatase domain
MKTLSIVGIGTKRFSQITLEALAQIQSSQAICFIETAEAVIKEYVSGTQTLVNLDRCYKTDRTDIENYKEMMKNIIKTLEIHDHASFIVAGHPRLGVFLTKALEAWGRGKQVQVRVFEGISSFDVMANVLEMDILENGTSIIDINRALLYGHKINTQCDHFFYHICSVANPVADYQGRGHGNRLDLLKEYLLQFYSPEHPLALVKAANSANDRSVVTYYTVDQVDQLKSQINFSTTLYVPAVKSDRANAEVLKIMKKAGGVHESPSIQ